MKADIEKRVRAHGVELLRVFSGAVERDPVKLCRKLRRLEARAYAMALRWFNGDSDQAALDDEEASILAKLDALLGYRAAGVPVEINLDPRGYALKIDDTWTRDHAPALHRDWGGYGILAPDLSGGR